MRNQHYVVAEILKPLYPVNFVYYDFRTNSGVLVVATYTF